MADSPLYKDTNQPVEKRVDDLIVRMTVAEQLGQMVQADSREYGAELIIVGQPLDEEGVPNFEGRKAARLAAEIRAQTTLQVALWDESFSTRDAHTARRELGSPRGKRKSHLDDLAATVILQSYLDAQHPDKMYEET